MSKKSLARLTRIVTGTFGTAREELFSFDTNLTRFERFVHFWVLVVRSFVRNRCPIRASALSYTTLLALIPMLAVGMSVTSIFLKETGKQRIQEFIESFVERMVPAAAITEAVPQDLEPVPTSTQAPDFAPVTFDVTNFLAAIAATNAAELTNGVVGETNAPGAAATAEIVMGRAKEDVSAKAASYIHKFVENTYSGTLGVTGMVFLVLTAILTLTRVEETFNDIWGVTRGRDWLARVTNYFTAIALGPTLLIAALGLASGPRFERTRDFISVVPYLEPLISTLLPVALICVTFGLFYKLVPNTKVDFSAALVGGSLAGVAWHFYNQIGFLLASRAVSASKIYGGLALIPLLMGGLYVVWLTVLFGAQVAYAFQNRAAYLQEKLAENVNQRGREFVALRLMTCIGQRFHRGLPPPTIREISTELGVPSRLAQQVLHTLVAAHLVVEVAGLETGYAPARPLDDINCHHILLAMRATQGQELVTRDEPVRAEVLGEFARIQTAEREAASTVTMLALVSRAQARLQLAASPVAGGSAIPAPGELDGVKNNPEPKPAKKSEIAAPAPKIEFEPEPTPGATVSEAGSDADSTETIAPPVATATVNDDQDETQKFPL